MVTLTVLGTLGLTLHIVTIVAGVVIWRRTKHNQGRIDAIVTTIAINARAETQIRANEDRIDAIVEIMMRNARTSVMTNRLWSAEEQRISTEAAGPYFHKIKADLQRYFRQTGMHLNERELFLDIQKRFGAALERDVCIPLGLQNNECIMIAMEVMKELGDEHK